MEGGDNRVLIANLQFVQAYHDYLLITFQDGQNFQVEPGQLYGLLDIGVDWEKAKLEDSGENMLAPLQFSIAKLSGYEIRKLVDSKFAQEHSWQGGL